MLLKNFLTIISFTVFSIVAGACATNKPDGGFLPSTYDVPIDLDVQNQQNSPNL